MAVGRGQTCTPMLDRVGMMAVSDARPKPDRSWIAATRLMTRCSIG